MHRKASLTFVFFVGGLAEVLVAHCDEADENHEGEEEQGRQEGSSGHCLGRL